MRVNPHYTDIIGDNSDWGQDALSQVEMGNPNIIVLL